MYQTLSKCFPCKILPSSSISNFIAKLSTSHPPGASSSLWAPAPAEMEIEPPFSGKKWIGWVGLAYHLFYLVITPPIACSGGGYPFDQQTRNRTSTVRWAKCGFFNEQISGKPSPMFGRTQLHCTGLSSWPIFDILLPAKDIISNSIFTWFVHAPIY